MTQYRTEEQVKKFDIFKIVTFGILVILLLFAFRFFGPVQNPPAIAQATTEPTTAVPATAEPTEATEAEAAPAPTSPTLDSPGEVTAGEVTLTGTGEPGSEVEIVVDGKVVGQATVDSDGKWSFATDLPDAGEYEISVQSVDADGKVLAASEAVALTVAEALEAPALDSLDEVTAGEVTLTGTGEPGSEVEIVVDGKVVGQATVDSDGKWSFATDLPDAGEYEISVQSVDADGKVLAESNAVALTVAEALEAPALDSLNEVTAGEVTLTGTGEPGSEVEIVVDGKVVGKTTVGRNGQWSFAADLSEAGDYKISVQGVGEAGSVGAASAEMSIAVAPEDDGQAYIVQADDWLTKLALKFYSDLTKYPAIVEATNAKAQGDSTFDVITNPDLIEIGQKLWIPAEAP
ncbi:MAG: hypothetical protein HC875_00945 [Anaerolineales bacterium]|nr:hypothetical protein [Anaerolineales bacterium]